MNIFEKVHPNVDIREIPTDSLAYIGDAVFNLFIKLSYFKKTSAYNLHKNTHSIVNRKNQAEILDALLPLLNEEELSFVKRGINSKGASKYGNDPAYRKSTGFEVLVGYLYLINQDRLYSLLKEVLK
ncbi:ribonuclease III domain-containing protein [Thermosipho atlanticus]|uniref:Mini-ribonuclease 3 n=1 Tax=Thermosipho atlanticus DSM 15807 TaxID=1123380 RepID=A0A1M5SFW1_9BACT|nr:ribonuclease III domain-containing protein [Thermosipho atlanticus]SHH36773.1 ribonuclease-3 family protein [Thermosipho atlanticus DSM 15807]